MDIKNGSQRLHVSKVEQILFRNPSIEYDLDLDVTIEGQLFIQNNAKIASFPNSVIAAPPTVYSLAIGDDLP